MIHADKIGLRTKLTRALGASDNILRIADLPRFRPERGDVKGHYWLTIDDGSKREFVRVEEAVSGGLRITRAVDNTQAFSFAAGTCVSVEWNESALDEFLGSRGLPEPIVQPGVYCLDCTTCITVNDQGQIVSIDGVKSC